MSWQAASPISETTSNETKTQLHWNTRNQDRQRMRHYWCSHFHFHCSACGMWREGIDLFIIYKTSLSSIQHTKKNWPSIRWLQIHSSVMSLRGLILDPLKLINASVKSTRTSNLQAAYWFQGFQVEWMRGVLVYDTSFSLSLSLWFGMHAPSYHPCLLRIHLPHPKQSVEFDLHPHKKKSHE